MGRTMPITISDEEQPPEGTTKDIVEPRQTIAGDEPQVTTEAEKNAVSKRSHQRKPGKQGKHVW